MKSIDLRPGDVAVALQLCLTGGETLAGIAALMGRSIGEIHNATGRLAAGRLVLAGSREVNREALLRFIRWGVPHAFPAVTGGPAVGTATCWIPEDAGLRAPEGVSEHPRYVWPDVHGAASGSALLPLYPVTQAAAAANPGLWALLSLVDLVRVGSARDVDAAMESLTERVGPVNRA